MKGRDRKEAPFELKQQEGVDESSGCNKKQRPIGVWAARRQRCTRARNGRSRRKRGKAEGDQRITAERRRMSVESRGKVREGSVGYEYLVASTYKRCIMNEIKAERESE